MTINVTMPQMGESIYEGTLTKWLKHPGENVEKDEPLFEISTDKVDSEIPSPASGTLSEILVPEGKTVQVHAVVAIITERDEKDARAAEPQPVPDKATEKPASEPVAAKGKETDTVSEVRIDAMPEAPRIPSPEGKPVEKPARGIQIQTIRTSPLVRKIARENKIDLSDVPGTGLEGRITRQDIQQYIERISTATVPETESRIAAETGSPVQDDSEALPAEEPVKPSPMEDAFSRFAGESEVVPMTSMRKAIAEHMVYSKRTSAHVNTVFEVDLQKIVQLRQRYKEEFEKREGIPLTYTPFFAKTLVDTVREFPIFNASLSGNNIVYKKPINLGVAVALDAGLIVPVIKNAQLKNLTGIALKIADLAERARTKKLKPEEVQDGTISLTNPGRYGALFATPIISQPQVAILGIGGIAKRPVVIDDAIAIRPMVHLSLTFDHRVIDGALADQFMSVMKEKLQSWTQWTD